MPEDNFDENFEAKLTASKREAKEEPEGHLTIDVFHTDGEIVVQSTIAGVNKEDLDISLSKDMITIRGKRMSKYKVKSSDYDHQELYWGPFSRAIILPEDVDVDDAKASIENGILTVVLPKLERTKVKKVKIS